MTENAKKKGKKADGRDVRVEETVRAEEAVRTQEKRGGEEEEKEEREEGRGDETGEEEGEEKNPKPAASGVWLALLGFLLLVGLLTVALDADLADAVVTFPKREAPPSARERVESVVERSLSLRARGDYDQAYRVLMDLHNEIPEDPQINLELARIYLEKEDNGLFPFAEDYLDLAAEALPRSAKIAYFRGVLEMRKGEEMLRRGRLASARGNEWLQIVVGSSASLEKAMKAFSAASEGPSPYNLAKAREFRDRCRRGLVENALSAAETHRDLAKGAFGVNPATLGLGIRRLHEALALEGLNADERSRLTALKNELEGGR